MQLLVLGGTRFVGRAIVDEALRRGHDVSTFNRGTTGETRPGVESLHGDRTRPESLDVLRSRNWDAVIDTGVFAPDVVGVTARLLSDHTPHYTFVSTLRAYRDWPAKGVTEDSPIHDCPATATDAAYGPGKAGGERAVSAAFTDRCLLVRAGIIVGPHELPPRLPWWLTQFADAGATGSVVAPGSPGDELRVVDVRDLASWIVDNARRRIPGAVNIPGEAGHTFGELMAACADATGSTATVDWVADDDLIAAGAQPWWHPPFWAPGALGYGGAFEVSDDRCLMTGMRYRPLAETVCDTWTYLSRQRAHDESPSMEVPYSLTDDEIGYPAGVLASLKRD